MRRSNNSDNQDNKNVPVKLSIASHFTDAVKFLQVISLKPFITSIERDADQVLFKMRGNVSLVYCHHNTSHYSSRHRNDKNKLIKKKVLKCLRVRKFVDIVLLIPSTLPQVIVDLAKFTDICLLIPATILLLIVEVVDIGQV